jgi:hypothetical protein
VSGPLLEKVILGDELTNTAALALAEHCSKVNMVSLSLCLLLNDGGLAPLRSRCGNLTTLPATFV